MEGQKPMHNTTMQTRYRVQQAQQAQKDIRTKSAIPVFRLSDKNAIEERSSTGWLLKWRIPVPNSNRHIWVKAPGFIVEWGGESYAEILTSAVCKDFKYDNYITYYPCIVIYNSIRLFCCYSYDFCEENNERLLSYSKLFQTKSVQLGVVGIADYKKVLHIINKCTGLNVQKQFEDILFLDYLVNNLDRGFHNFGVLIKQGGYCREAPIFDNGNSFNLPSFENGQYERRYRYSRGETALPFRETFEDQLNLIRRSRVYRTDFLETRKALKWLMENASEKSNKLDVINNIPLGCFQYIAGMLKQNYQYYKVLFNIQN